MQCKWCKNSCKRDGRRANGTQKYRCKNCLKYQQLLYKYKAYCSFTHEEFRRFQRIGVPFRGMAEFMKISRNTLIKWIRRALTLESNYSFTPELEYEVDEIKTYIGNKETGECWIAYTFHPSTHQVVSLHVGKRTVLAMKPMMQSLLKFSPSKIKTDGLATYKALLEKESSIKHIKGKHVANHIERNHVNLRKDIAYLIRKTICYAKDIENLEARIRWYFWGNQDPYFFLK